MWGKVATLLVVFCVWTQAELIQTPFGFSDEKCVHRIPSDSHIFERNGETYVITADGKKLTFPKCASHRETGNISSRAPSVYHGWQAYTTFHYPAGINAFIGSFSVPPSPQQQPGILYIFTGLQNINWIPEPNGPPPSGAFDIIQPVLEYTDGYWSLASWYVTLEAGYLVSNAIPISPGDEVFGNMTQTGPDSWFILSEVQETSKKTSLTVTKDRLKIQPWAYNTLEVYSVSSCDQYPNKPIVFSDLALYSNGQKITPKWEAHKGTEIVCDEHAVISSPSKVSLYFRQQ